MSLTKRSRRRGAVMVEYAFLLVAVAIPTMAGLVIGGTKLLASYQTGRNHILRAVP
jgi:hypothetical protein